MALPFLWSSFLFFSALFGGTVLLILPGIVLTVFTFLYPYVLFRQPQRGISALVASWTLVEGYWMQVLWRYIIGIVFFLVTSVFGGFLLGMALAAVLSVLQNESGLIANLLQQSLSSLLNYGFMTPLYTIYAYMLYNALRDRKKNIQNVGGVETPRRVLIGFLAVGIVAVIALVLLGIFAPSTKTEDMRQGSDSVTKEMMGSSIAGLYPAASAFSLLNELR